MRFNLSFKQKGIITLSGGFLIHLVLGSFYLWGAINIYITSYYRIKNDPDLNITLAQSVFPIMLVGMSLTIPFGVKLAKKTNFWIACAIESLLIFFGVFSATFSKTFWGFLAGYGLTFGLMIGLLYMVPIYLGCQYFPSHKGLVSGLITGAFGFSTLISSEMVLHLVNPNNKKPIKIDNQQYFEWDIASRVPSSIRYLSLYFLVLGLIGSTLLFSPKKKSDQSLIQFNYEEALENHNKQNNISLLEALKTKIFYLQFFMIFLSSSFGFMLVSNIKSYGFTKQKEKNDDFLTLVTSLASLCNGGSRILWGYLFDKVGFIKTFGSVLLLQIIVLITLDYIADNQYLYLIWVCTELLCEGGHFALFPALSIQTFGTKNGADIYGLIYFAFCLANGFQFLIVFFFQERIGYQNLFYIFLGMTLMSLALLVCFWKINHQKSLGQKNQSLDSKNKMPQITQES